MKLFSPCVVLGLLCFSPLATKVSAQASTQPSCSIRVFKVSANEFSTEQSVATDLIVGTKYRFSVSLMSAGSNTIRSVYSQMMAKENEPLTITGVSSPVGSCSIGADKTVSCENLSYQFSQKMDGAYHLTVVPTEGGPNPYSSVLFSFETDQGKAVCATMHKIVTPVKPTPEPKSTLPAVSNLRIKGYRSLTGYESNYKEAVLAWDYLPGAVYYELVRMNANPPYSNGGTKDTTYALRFLPDTVWDVAFYAQDQQWNRGELSSTIHIAYPGYDTLPTVPSSNSTPSPTATPPELTAPQNVRVTGFESVPGSTAMNAVLTWSKVPGASYYQLFVQDVIGNTPDALQPVQATQARVPGQPGVTKYVGVEVYDTVRNIRLRSETLTVLFPQSTNQTPGITPKPLPTVTPRPFDSTKVALLEEKVSSLEQKLQAQDQTNAMQTQRIEQQESILTKIRNFLSRWFRI